MNFYTPLFLNKDFDNDGLDDIITVHGGDPIRKPRMFNILSNKINKFLYI
jgi:hypothetical protein